MSEPAQDATTLFDMDEFDEVEEADEQVDESLDRDRDGIEDESEGEGDGEITEPFDPARIDVRAWQPTIQQLVDRIKDRALILDPYWQRRVGIWTVKAQSRLIESILMRIPLPSFYIDATDEDRMLVVDGAQRLTAMYRYVSVQDLRLTDLEFLREYNGAAFDGLPRNLQRRIVESQVTVYQIQPGTPEAAKLNIFKRINTGGLPLSPQEIRQAVYWGKGVLLLQRLAESDSLREATDGALRRTERLQDHELVLRFLAFATCPYQQYRGPDLDAFLSERLRYLNRIDDDQREELARRFQRAMESAHRVFGARAFRKPWRGGERRKPLNRALFEAWAVSLDVRTDDELETLVTRKSAVMRAFRASMLDNEFERSVTAGTGEPRRVRARFGTVERIIEEVLSC